MTDESLDDFVEVRKRLDRLSREHRDLKKTLQNVQQTTAFYQDSYQKADQVLTALKKGSVKTPSFKPEFLRDKEYLESIRELSKEAVYARWSSEKRPSQLIDIYRFVKRRIQVLIDVGEWDAKAWTPPSKRTVDRRVNEAADQKYWDGPTPIIALRAGLYIPNPSLFDEEGRRELERMADAPNLR